MGSVQILQSSVLCWLTTLAFQSTLARGGHSSEDCRVVIWEKPMSDKIFRGHVIRNSSAGTRHACENDCYEEPFCVSYNFDPVKLDCQMISANDASQPGNMADSPGHLHRSIRNACVGVRCPNINMACQTGFGGVDMYRCVCSKCLKGNNCDEGDFLMQFPAADHTDHLKIIKGLSLWACTVGVWISVKSSMTARWIYSISTATTSNAMYILHENGVFKLKIKNRWRISTATPSLYDGLWHHVAATWESTILRLYINGVKTDEWTVPEASGFVIQNGILIIGHDQDSHGGHLESSQSFLGTMTSFNIWDRVFSAIEISSLANNCPSREGNVVSWKNLMTGVIGDIKMICPAECGNVSP